MKEPLPDIDDDQWPKILRWGPWLLGAIWVVGLIVITWKNGWS